MPCWISRCTFSNCVLDATGPIAVASSALPTLTCSATSRAIVMASAIREFGTSMRDGALQLCPELGIMLATPARTPSAKPPSSRTMLGLLPPSSWVTRFTVGAAFLATSMPARVDPVNDTMSMSGWLASAAPTPAPSPLTRLNTPAGTPAAARISAKMYGEYGATSEGFRTTVQPVASAGYTLTATWLIGQFHGVIKPQTPIGSLAIRVSPLCSENGKFFSTSMAVVRWPMPRKTCGPAASEGGAPISSVTASARSSARFWYSARMDCNRSRRCSRVLCDQPAKARRAA